MKDSWKLVDLMARSKSLEKRCRETWEALSPQDKLSPLGDLIKSSGNALG